MTKDPFSELHCIYHGGCPDGFTAYWAVQWLHPGIEVIPHFGAYGTPPPEEIPNDSHVIIADFSYPAEQLKAFADRMASVRVYDHHQTAQSDLEDFHHPNVQIVFDMERSGAGITWDELATRREGIRLNVVQDIFENVLVIDESTDSLRPMLLNFVEARDLWRMDQTDVPEVGAFIMTLEHDLDVWTRAMNTSLQSLRQLGAGALAQRQQFCRSVMPFSTLAMFENPVPHDRDQPERVVMPVVNVSYPIGSETAQALMEYHDSDMAAYYFKRADGTWQYGFRSRSGSDCSAIAKWFGGGGHKEASGCQGFTRQIHAELVA